MSTINDAPNRSHRTLLQGGVAVALIAATTALLEWLQAGDFSLRTLGVSATTAVLMAVLAYLHRAYLDPTSIPSATPPADPGPPADEAGRVDVVYVLLVVLLVLVVLALLGVV